jgi:hypothetical protein
MTEVTKIKQNFKVEIQKHNLDCKRMQMVDSNVKGTKDLSIKKKQINGCLNSHAVPLSSQAKV